MSSNGTLTFYNEEKTVFETVFIHHIESNYLDDIDSLVVLNTYYKEKDLAKKLVEKGCLSHFDKDNIVESNDEFKAVETESIDKLKELTSYWSSTNYVYYLGHWYPDPKDVDNIFYKKESYKNYFDEYGHYNLSIKKYDFFISDKFELSNMNINISKLIILEYPSLDSVVLCVGLSNPIIKSIDSQIVKIYKKITTDYPDLKNAKWYQCNPNREGIKKNYQLFNVNFDEYDNPSWESDTQISEIESLYNLEGLDVILKSFIYRN